MVKWGLAGMVAAAAILFACGSRLLSPATPIATVSQPRPPLSQAAVRPACGGTPLRVHFYDVGQALSALVDLPDGRHILVDTGDAANRPGCGEVCSSAHKSLIAKLGADLAGRPIDLMWITHQHSDHIGGAADILGRFPVKSCVDNGRDLDVAEIKDVRETAAAKGVPVAVVEPGHEELPLADTGDVHLRAIAPSSWLPKCATDRNECSILLRIDYCASSILFTGDEELDEEPLLDTHGSATLLQVGHHGSDTSSGAAFVSKVQPQYAVISAGKPGEGVNRTYCHPRASSIQALTEVLGGSGTKTIRAFDSAVSCKMGTDANWIYVPASDRLWATERDGDVVLVTTGDGRFERMATEP